MNVSEAGTQVYGVDIDPSCVDVARSSKLLVEANCFQRDFLTSLPRELPGVLRRHRWEPALRAAPLDQGRPTGIRSGCGG